MSMYSMTRETHIALGAPADVQICVEAGEDVSLDARMAGHDWYYFSDRDSAVFQRGEDARKRIVVELKTLPIEQALHLWKRYAPEYFAFPCDSI